MAPLSPVTVHFGNFVMQQRLACLMTSCLSPHCMLRLPQLHIVYLLILAPCGRGSNVIYFRLMTSKTLWQNQKKCQRATALNNGWSQTEQSLAHMYINRDLELDYDGVIDEFAVKNRRLLFIWHWWHWRFWLSIWRKKRQMSGVQFLLFAQVLFLSKKL